MKVNTRNEFFDVLKGLGILCVFYGHTARWGTLPSRMIFSFHMPLFFLISGIFFDIGKIPDFLSLVRKIWRNLMLPYCFFVVVGSLIKFDLTITSWSSHPIKQFVYLLHGTGSNSIWFLVCLTMVQFFAWYFYRSLSRYLSSDIINIFLIFSNLIVAHLILLFLPKSIINRIPFMLASVPAAMVFFATGRLFAKRLYDYGYNQAPFHNQYQLLLLLVISIILFITVVFFTKRTFDLRCARLTGDVLPACVLGLTTAFLVAKTAFSISALRFILSGLGSRSLYLFSLELPLSYLVSKITYGKIPYLCLVTPHPYWIEPLRIVIILIMAFALSYPTQWALTHLRRRFAPIVTTT